MEIADLLLSLFPIGLVMFLMVRFHWKSLHAGMAGWASTLLIAGLHFGATPTVLFWAQVRGLFLALYVLYVIWGALLFYRVTETVGTIQSMAELLKRLSPSRAFQVLLIAWGFASFLESVSGFGVPAAIVAPLLVGMGFSPLLAVVLPSLGHAWAISFGSLGSPFYALLAATGIDGALLAPWSAAYLGLTCLLMGAATLWAAGGFPALRECFLPLLVMSSVTAGVQLIGVTVGVWNIAAMLGALAGLLVGSLWALSRNTRAPSFSPALLRKALLPYALILLLIFAAQWILPLRAALNALTVQIQVPEVATTRGWTTPAGFTRGISPFGHTGALLLYASLIAFVVSRLKGVLQAGSGPQIVQQAVKRGMDATPGILFMVAMAATLDHAGMLPILAQTLASVTGRAFPLVSPLIGALGAFVTGSNTNSNVLFGALQRDIAQMLGYAAPVILAAQNAGGALGSTFAPAKVILGCSTVGAGDQEGEVMRHLLKYALAALGVLALLTWAITQGVPV